MPSSSTQISFRLSAVPLGRGMTKGAGGTDGGGTGAAVVEEVETCAAEQVGVETDGLVVLPWENESEL